MTVALSAVAFFVFAFEAFTALGPAGARRVMHRGVLGVTLLSAVLLSSLSVGEASGGSLFWAATLAGALVGAFAAFLVDKR